MKKLISITLTVIMLLSAFTVIPTVGAKVKTYKSNNCIYTVDKNYNATVVGWEKSTNYWKIPERLKGHKVRKIELNKDCCSSWTLPDKIKIPKNVKSITKNLNEYIEEKHLDDYEKNTRIVCYKNSYAYDYVHKNKINYIISGDNKTCGDIYSLLNNYGYKMYNEKNKRLSYPLDMEIERLYNGNAQKPKVKIVKDKFTLKEGRDYTLKYLNNYTVGKAYVMLAGKGNYWGAFILNFTIKPTQAQLVSINQRSETSVECNYVSTTYSYPNQMIEYSTDKTFKTKKRVISPNSYEKKEITGLEKGKTYYFRVAHFVDTPYIYVRFDDPNSDSLKLKMTMGSNERFYGKWSNVKSITL